MSLLQSISNTVSAAGQKVYNIGKAINNLGTGNADDPVLNRYPRGSLNAISVQAVESHAEHAEVAEQVVKRNHDGSGIPDFKCPDDYPNGFVVCEGYVASCIATSKDIAPDGCAFEGRYTTCNNGTLDLNACPSDYLRLQPPCPDPHDGLRYPATFVAVGASLATGVLAAGCLVKYVVVPYGKSVCSAIGDAYNRLRGNDRPASTEESFADAAYYHNPVSDLSQSQGATILPAATSDTPSDRTPLVRKGSTAPRLEDISEIV